MGWKLPGWPHFERPTIKLPPWNAQDWRAQIALISGIAGGAALTVSAMWIVYLLVYMPWPEATAPSRIRWLGWALMLALAGSVAQLISQGLAINKRKIQITKGGIIVEGGSGTAGEAIDKATTAAANLPLGVAPTPPAPTSEPGPTLAQEPEEAAAPIEEPPDDELPRP